MHIAEHASPGGISIHALLAESDAGSLAEVAKYATISIHALLAESDCARGPPRGKAPRFLSTLSLRRATNQPGKSNKLARHFYPRSPCGERPTFAVTETMEVEFLSTLSLRRATRGANHATRHLYISIHALLAESDSNRPVTMHTWKISIHALLAESDWTALSRPLKRYLFLSTLSLRRATDIS